MDKTRTSLSFTAFGITYNYLIIRNLKLLLVTKVKTILKILKNIPPTSLKKFNQIYLELLRINATLKHFQMATLKRLNFLSLFITYQR